jgi:hypothetical protein
MAHMFCNARGRGDGDQAPDCQSNEGDGAAMGIGDPSRNSEVPGHQRAKKAAQHFFRRLLKLFLTINTSIDYQHLC